MREKTVKVYKFDELSDRAKERAREWWRSCEAQEQQELDEWAETAAKLLGIEFDTRTVKLMGGGTRGEPKVYWRGFSSQGDGASFEAHYAYAKGSAKAVRKEFPKDEKLHAIADGLAELQKPHGYRLTANVKRDPYAHYVHEMTMKADVYNGDAEADEDAAEGVLELMRDFARWIYRGLEQEYEDRMSDENVDESMRINEYEFDEEGEVQ